MACTVISRPFDQDISRPEVVDRQISAEANLFPDSVKLAVSEVSVVEMDIMPAALALA